MKAKIGLALAVAALLMNAGFDPAGSPRLSVLGGAVAHAGVRVDFGFFYDELAPYGDWRRVEPHGWVWYPDVEGDWRPYTVGYWVFTDDYGWTWIAEDPWGSIPFHYGRWFYDDDYGRWAWVPGTEWGPAWVGWRSGGGYIGWAPLPPEARFEPSVGFAPSDPDFGGGWNSWCFVPTARFLSPRIERVIVPRPRNVTLIKNTVNITRYTVIDRRVVNRSIDLGRFEGETRTRVARYRVDEIDRPVRRGTPVRNGRVVLFRPQVVGTAVAPPPTVRPPRPGAPRDHRPERQIPGTAPWEHRTGDRDQDRRDRGEWPEADRRSPNGPRAVEFEGRDGQRPPVEQGRHGQRPGAEQRTSEEQRQEAEKERARRWAEREQRQQTEQDQARQRTDQERAQQQAEREQARQRAVQQQQQTEQQEQARQREQEKVQRQAEREQARQQQREQERAQRQAEREQARQQQQQTEQNQTRQRTEQERAQHQAERDQARQQQQVEQEQARRQEQARQRAEQERAQKQAEQARQQQQQQQVEQEQTRQRAEQERAQRQAEREAQRQAERESQRQAEQARRQAERQAEREAQRQAEQAQRQAEREQARQQAVQQQQQQRQQQAEQERQRRRNLPECKSLPPGQQQECR